MAVDPDTELSRLIAEAGAIVDEARARFGSLTPPQLNWQPGAERWSVAQCLDHLVTANRSYFPTFDRILSGHYRHTWWQRVPGLPRLLGRMLLGAIGPEAARKMTAPKIFQPARSTIEGAIVGRFIDQQQQVIRYLETSRQLDVARIVIASPVHRAITYSLLDAYRIIVAHEHRHFLQARRVMTTPGFPSASGTDP